MEQFTSSQRRRPLIIDSTLLRIMSSQGKRKRWSDDSMTNIVSDDDQLKRQQQNEFKNISDSSDRSNTKKTESRRLFGILQSYDDERIDNNIVRSISESTIDTDIADSKLENMLYERNLWVLDYSSHRVVDILLSRWSTTNGTEKLDTEVATEAGSSVQTAAMSRASRRIVQMSQNERNSWLLSNRDSQLVTTAVSGNNINYEAAKYDTSFSNVEQVVDLLLEYGLSIRDIAEIFIHSPAIAFMRPRPLTLTDDATLNENSRVSSGETLKVTLDRVFGLLMGPKLKLRKYDARKVIRNTPGILSKSGSRSSVEVVGVLSQLGVSSNSIARDKSALPRLLSRSPADLFRLVAFLASDAIRMPMNNIGPLLRRTECTKLLDLVAPVPWKVLPHLQETQQSSAIGKGENRRYQYHVQSQAERIYYKQLVDEFYRGMTATAWTLRNRIGTADLGKVIAAYPSVLLLDANKQILPNAKYLMRDLGIWVNDLPRILQLYPAVLGVEKSEMQKNVEYLLSLGVEKEGLSSIFRSFPSLLTMDVQRDMEPVVEFLSNDVGIANVGRFISRLPPVLGYSVQNELKPKWDYLQEISNDAKFAVTKFPAVFSYPLNRFRERYDYLRYVKGMQIRLLPIDQVLCNGDRDFAANVARDKDNGVSYGQYLVKRKGNPGLTTTAIPRRREKTRLSTKPFVPKTNSDGTKFNERFQLRIEE
jgi:mTERF